MKYIQQKMEELGGVDFLRKGKSEKTRQKLIAAEKPEAAVVALIDLFGYGFPENTIVYKSIDRIPVAGGKKGAMELILGWGNNEKGIPGYLRNLKEEEEADDYFPFAEGYPGDLLCIRTKGKDKGKVYYWSHDDGEFFLVAKTFKGFIMSLRIEKEEKKSGKNKKNEPELISAWFADDF